MADAAEGGSESSVEKGYLDACTQKSKTPNVGIQRSLLKIASSTSSDSTTTDIALVAPGNDPQCFENRIDDIHIGILTQTLAPLIPKFIKIDLAYNHITDDGCATIASTIIQNGTSLKALKLRGNQISSVGIEAMFLGVRVHCLQKLDISQNCLGKLGGLALAAFLQTNETLLELYASDTDLDIDALIAISAVLHVNNDTLRILDVENPRLFSLQGEHCTHLGKMLRVNPSLTEIYFGKFRFRDLSVELFLDDVGHDQGRLRVLDLRCNEIGATGAMYIAELVKYGNLHTLNLNSNRIGEHDNVSGAKALGEAMQESRTLQKLFVNHNDLCDQALFYLIDPFLNGNISRDFAISLFWNSFADPLKSTSSNSSGANSAAKTLHQVYVKQKVFAFHCDAVTQLVNDTIFVCEVNQGWQIDNRDHRL